MSDLLTPEQAGTARFWFEDYAVGQAFRSHGRTITDADIRTYLGATGTDHPNHTDEEYCRAHPLLEGVCAPGVLVLGIVDGFIADTVTRYMSSSMNYGHDRIRYLRPVYVRDTLHAEIRVAACTVRDDTWGVVTVEATARNQRDEPVLFDSHLLIVQRRP
ncbi:acyl dehydratase [Pseudonocardia hierapolitana]|uniref:Acyl dehydratase n=1 Tax=Pseudonocardia hierapolitana TaxID=1128676 RepID=A0A561SJI0_9PSEU|nr:MaoC/PaaZ C-terminal domain-containing protein [Pseudonocardia hierapolitana]TWF75015.1 acyl dehydratase [Pseudonocardia hierapolitana]